jgi:acyl-[acyl carrier protein]--UDP-N-acetylglucosamine O-acyltransferase
MRVSVLVLLAACSVSGNEGAQEPSRDGFFARTGAHTGDTQDTFNGLPLDPQLDSCVEDLAVCDVDYCALDLEGSAANDTCVHSTAIIDGTFGAGVTIKSGAEIGRNAHLSDGATLGVNSILAPFARVHEDAEIGDGTVIGRRAIVGARSEIGPDSRLNRASEVGADVDAVIGDLTMGYASFLGARSRVLGTNVILGSQARIGADSTLYGNVVVARGATFLNHTLLETGVIVGPNVQAGHHVTLRAHVRVRKNATFENNIEVGSGSRIGRDSSLREGSSVGSDSTIRANVTVGTNQHLDEDTYAPHGTVYEDLGGVVLDYPPVVEITSPTDGVDGDGGSLTLAGTVSDDNGVTSMTYRIDDGAESAMLFSGGLWSVPVSFPDRTQTIRITAYDALGQTGSDLLFVSDCNPSGTIHHTWTGAVDSTWSEAGNWSPSGPPSSTDSIFVCGATTNQPVLTAPASVGDAYLDYSAFVDTNDFKLTVTDDIAGGTIGGTGTVEMSGTGTIKGTVSNLRINGFSTLSGYVRATGNLTILASKYLQVNAKTLQVDGNYTSSLGTVNYGLMMHHDASDVTITGDALFNGAGTMYPTLMTTGIVRVGGNFSVASADVLRVEGTTFEFNGTAPQLVTFNRSHTDESYFYHLSITNPTAVTLVDTNETNFYAKGNLTIANGGTLNTIENFKVAGTTHLLEEATYNGTNVLDVTGTITVSDISTMAAARLRARSYLNMDPSAILTGNRVELYTKMVIPSDDYTATETHIAGLITLADDWNHAMPHLVIDAGKYLQVNGKTMVLDGNFTQSLTTGSYGLRMHHTTSDVTITGDATFGGSGTMSSGTLANGIVRVAGHFIVSAPYVFRPNGTRFELNGTAAQNVTFTHSGAPYSWFHHLRVRNPNTVTIVATSTTTVQVNGDLDLLNGTTVTTGESVTALGTASLSEGSTYNGTAVLDVGNTITIADTSTMNANTLRARWYLNMHTAAILTGNRVELYGKMAIPSDHYSATETHIAGRITLEGNWVHTMPHLIIDASQYLQVNAKTMILDGDFTSTLGTVNYGLMMHHDDSDVTITGNATFTGAGTMYPTLMTKGIVRVAGDFTVTSADVLRAEGTTFEFNGATPQLVTFNRSHTDESYFYHLSVTNPTTVTLVDTNESNFYAKGNLTVRNGGTLTTIENFKVGGTVQLLEGATYHGTNVLDVSGTITIADTSTMDAATLHARSYLNMAPTSSLTGNHVYLYSKMVIPSDNYTAGQTHLSGLITLADDWDHTMPHLVIDAGKYLQVNGKTMVLDGNFTQSLTTGSYGLRMHHTTSDVTITGDATFGGSGTMSSGTLANGIVRVAGHFIVSAPYVFRPNGTHFEFDGTAAQNVTFTHSGTPYSWFHNVTVSNGSAAGVTYGSNVYSTSATNITGKLVNNGTATSAGGLTIASGGTLDNTGNVWHYGSSYTQTGTLIGNTPVL